MPISAGLLMEWEAEAAKTRQTLKRIPEDKFGWKPHPKSGSMIWLAGHLANMAGWAAMVMQTEELDISPGGKEFTPPPVPASREELLATFDKNMAEGHAAIAKASDEEMMKPWRLLMNGTELFRMPRAAVLRNMIMNHSIHHRGQFTVYLRLNDVPVPALYGPSADEG
jgi:uncharacterized damage-inducible protein DinB